MTELAFKNQELSTFIPARDISSITPQLINGTAGIPDADILGLSQEAVFYYAANNLIITLDDGLPADWFFSGPEIRVNGFWKVRDVSIDGTEAGKYQRFETDANVEVFTPGRIVFSINPSDKDEVAEAYSSLGIQKPDFGLLLIVLSFTRAGTDSRQERAYCVKYSHLPLFSSAPINFNLPVFLPQENSYKSPPVSFETFFIPTISSSFVYNFFEEDENDYDVYNFRDYTGFRLSEIPKYVKLNWNSPVFNYREWIAENTPPAAVGPIFSGIAISISGTTPPTSSVGLIAPIFSLVVPGSRVENTPPQMDETGLVTVMSDARGRTGSDADSAFDRRVGPMIEEAGTIPMGTVDPSVTQRIEPIQTIGFYTDYVGFIIEKVRAEEDGTFTVVDLIAVPGKNTVEYIDYKIAYGEVYRYRIRTVFRYVDVENKLSLFQDSDMAISREQAINYVDQRTSGATNQTYYFDSVYSEAAEIQTTEDVRPDAPDNVRVFPKSREKYILITWSQKNQARDVVGFNVYRKTKTQPFQKLNIEALDIRSNFYKDVDIEPDVEYIYAIESIDFHGNFSKLSAQYSIYTKEITSDEFVCDSKQKFYDIEGRELSDVPPPKDLNLVVCKNSLTLNVNPLYSTVDFSDDFMIKLTSLDTGMEKEINLKFKCITIYHAGGYVPATPEAPGIIFTGFSIDNLIFS